MTVTRFVGVSGQTTMSLSRALPAVEVFNSRAAWMQRWRNSIHIAIRFWKSVPLPVSPPALLRISVKTSKTVAILRMLPATLTSPISHTGMFVCQGSIRSLTLLSRSISSRRSSKAAAIRGSSAARSTVSAVGRGRLCPEPQSEGVNLLSNVALLTRQGR